MTIHTITELNLTEKCETETSVVRVKREKRNQIIIFRPQIIHELQFKFSFTILNHLQFYYICIIDCLFLIPSRFPV